MDLPQSSSGEETSDPKVKHPEPPEPSCVSVKSDCSMEKNPPGFSSGGGEPSCVSVKSDCSMEKNPPGFSRGGGEPSCVSVKSDCSMEKNPPGFSRGGGEPSCVSVKSDCSMEKNPPGFSRGGGVPSCVSVKSDCSMEKNPPGFSSGGGEPSCVSMKSDRSMKINPPGFSRGGGEPSCVSMKSDHSMGKNPPGFSSGGGEPSCVSMKSDPSMGKNPPGFSSGGGEPSCVSMKSDHSMGKNPPGFSSGGGEPSCVSVKSDCSMEKNPPRFSRGGGEPSCVSMKSDHSMGKNPPGFSSGGGEPSCVSMKSDPSMGKNPPGFSRGGGEPSCVSVKSDCSMEKNPPGFSRGGGEPSCVSVKSDCSMEKNPPGFSSGGGEPSCVSMKSDHSMGKNPPGFSSGGGEPSCVSMKSDRSMEKNPPGFSSGGGEPSCVSMKSECSMGKNPPGFSSGAAPSDPEQLSTKPTPHTHILVEGTGPLQKDTHQPVDDILHKVIERHKTNMKNKYESFFEGIKTFENRTLLNRIYTQLYIIEGESEGVNKEHEVLQMEKTPRRGQDTPINCSDIFKPLQDHKYLKHKERKEDEGPEVPGLRSVLTKGIAGIGKTVSVQKFILDWAEGKANQDVDFMFVLPFRELNLIKDHQYSLHGLLCDFHPEIKDLDPKIYDELKAVFIFDGLDESRLPLNFSQCEKVSDITMTSSVGVLMTNLIKGDLLPSALIWITCRPAAVNQIPPKHIHRVTEIQGFNDPQKEEYFRKRIRDQDQAQKIFSHIKTARSLHIMCHIPVFCWISATVLQRIINQHHTEIPKTLTEMYSHFLLTQTSMRKEKYEENDERDPKKLLESNRTELLKLAELAFKQLMKGNVMFYEEDLRESSIDVTEASVYSGIFTEIFREECVLYQRKVYCFVHLSFQEFLAAVYVFHCYERKNIKELQGLIPEDRDWSKNVHVDDLLKRAVDKALDSPNGHLDLFLRFLLGISLESNQKLLQGLLTHQQTNSETTREYIKNLIKDERRPLSTERSINLFLCLSEMEDQSLSREIQEYLNSEEHSVEKLSPGQCSALACMLLTSEEVLEELNLKKYTTSEEGYRRLIPAVTVCRRAVLANCDLTKNSCEALCTVLQLKNAFMKELDLSWNDLQETGVLKLSAGLRSSGCELETLRLAGCYLTNIACEALCFVLQSVNSSLKELDLSKNDLQDSRLELISAGVKNSHCRLETLILAGCDLTKDSCEALCSLLQSVNSLKVVDLSNNDLQDSGVELLSAGLKSSHCKLEMLRLSGCMVTEVGCFSLASALKSNPFHLRELDLTYNHPEESGMMLLSDLLKDPHYKLEKLLMEYGGKNRMKPGIKKYWCKITLDPNTANSNLFLFDWNRSVEFETRDKPYPDHPERFDGWPQVLSVESLTGRCYWEAGWKGWVRVDIAVTYRGIGRKGRGDDSQFGFNNQSWTLRYFKKHYSVLHNKKKICEWPSPFRCGKVGVYLDWPAGTLSFYNMSSFTHIYTLHTTFTEPLYAGICVFPTCGVCVE